MIITKKTIDRVYHELLLSDAKSLGLVFDEEKQGFESQIVDSIFDLQAVSVQVDRPASRVAAAGGGAAAAAEGGAAAAEGELTDLHTLLVQAEKEPALSAVLFHVRVPTIKKGFLSRPVLHESQLQVLPLTARCLRRLIYVRDANGDYQLKRTLVFDVEMIKRLAANAQQAQKLRMKYLELLRANHGVQCFKKRGDAQGVYVVRIDPKISETQPCDFDSYPYLTFKYELNGIESNEHAQAKVMALALSGQLFAPMYNTPHYWLAALVKGGWGVNFGSLNKAIKRSKEEPKHELKFEVHMPEVSTDYVGYVDIDRIDFKSCTLDEVRDLLRSTPTVNGYMSVMARSDKGTINSDVQSGRGVISQLPDMNNDFARAAVRLLRSAENAVKPVASLDSAYESAGCKLIMQNNTYAGLPNTFYLEIPYELLRQGNKFLVKRVQIGERGKFPRYKWRRPIDLSEVYDRQKFIDYLNDAYAETGYKLIDDALTEAFRPLLNALQKQLKLTGQVDLSAYAHVDPTSSRVPFSTCEFTFFCAGSDQYVRYWHAKDVGYMATAENFDAAMDKEIQHSEQFNLNKFELDMMKADGIQLAQINRPGQPVCYAVKFSYRFVVSHDPSNIQLIFSGSNAGPYKHFYASLMDEAGVPLSQEEAINYFLTLKDNKEKQVDLFTKQCGQDQYERYTKLSDAFVQLREKGLKVNIVQFQKNLDNRAMSGSALVLGSDVDGQASALMDVKVPVYVTAKLAPRSFTPAEYLAGSLVCKHLSIEDCQVVIRQMANNPGLLEEYKNACTDHLSARVRGDRTQQNREQLYEAVLALRSGPGY